MANRHGIFALSILLVWGRAPRPEINWRPLPAGTHPVGFVVENVVDSARGGPLSPRRIQLSIWYPASRATGRRLTYRDYLALAVAETTSSVGSAADKAEQRFIAPFIGHGVPATIVDAWLGARMTATWDAQPSSSRYPLIVIAQGAGESAHDQAVLAEYLASHGYVVATCPSQTRISGGLATEADIGPSAEDEARDLEFVIARMALRADANVGRVALVGHSFGARGALLLAMRRSDIGAVVSLDGGIGTSTGLESFRAAPSFAPDSLRAPVLHFYETLDPFMKPDWTILKSIHRAPVWIARTGAMHHHHFTSLGGLGAGFGALLRATNGTTATTRSFVEVATAVRAFVDTYIGGAPAAFDHARAAAGGLTIRRLSGD